MDVSIVEMPEIRLGAVRHIGPYQQIGPVFRRLGELAGPAGLFGNPGAVMIGLYHDSPAVTAPERLRSDAGITVPEGVPLPPGLEERRVPAGRYARTLHRGAYQGLVDTWARLMGEWLPASGQRMGLGPSVERYLNDPTRVKTEELETEILIPIA